MTAFAARPGATGPVGRDDAAGLARRWFAGLAGVDAGAAPVRLFCFAHAGGGGVTYRPWRTALAPGVDVRPVVLPGRELRIREPPARRVHEVLPGVCDAMATLLDRPYTVFGHSLGAALAYEAVRELVRRGLPGPEVLIVSGRRPPGSSLRRDFLRMPDETFLRAVAHLGGTPAEVLAEPGLVRLLLPVLRADFEINESYVPAPGPVLDCPVAAYSGDADPEVSPEEMLGWYHITSGAFTLRVFGGGHFYLQETRGDVLECVTRDLSHVRRR